MGYGFWIAAVAAAACALAALGVGLGVFIRGGGRDASRASNRLMQARLGFQAAAVLLALLAFALAGK